MLYPPSSNATETSHLNTFVSKALDAPHKAISSATTIWGKIAWFIRRQMNQKQTDTEEKELFLNALNTRFGEDIVQRLHQHIPNAEETLEGHHIVNTVFHAHLHELLGTQESVIDSKTINDAQKQRLKEWMHLLQSPDIKNDLIIHPEQIQRLQQFIVESINGAHNDPISKDSVARFLLDESSFDMNESIRRGGLDDLLNDANINKHQLPELNGLAPEEEAELQHVVQARLNAFYDQYAVEREAYTPYSVGIGYDFPEVEIHSDTTATIEYPKDTIADEFDAEPTLPKEDYVAKKQNVATSAIKDFLEVKNFLKTVSNDLLTDPSIIQQLQKTNNHYNLMIYLYDSYQVNAQALDELLGNFHLSIRSNPDLSQLEPPEIKFLMKLLQYVIRGSQEIPSGITEKIVENTLKAFLEVRTLLGERANKRKQLTFEDIFFKTYNISSDIIRGTNADKIIEKARGEIPF